MYRKCIYAVSGIAIAFFIVGFATGYNIIRTKNVPVEKRDGSGRILPHYLNNVRAESIKPGAALSSVIDELGDPIGVSDGWLLFFPSPNGRTIRVKLDSSGLVQKVDPGAN